VERGSGGESVMMASFEIESSMSISQERHLRFWFSTSELDVTLVLLLPFSVVSTFFVAQ